MSAGHRSRKVATMVVGSVAVGVVARRRLRRCLPHRSAGAYARWVGGRMKGVGYRLAGRHPAADVDDRTLADRIRSSLGPLEKRLDVPHVHVLVEDHVALLHGEVATEDDAHEIERAVRAVAGVGGVESYLHVGLVSGDTRPSEGEGPVPQPSAARRQLLDAARSAGAGTRASEAVRATLVAFCERVPVGEREHLFTHLPADVVGLCTSPRRHRMARRPRTAGELVADVLAEGEGIPADRVERIVEAVVGCFRRLVPDEAADVAAVLPGDLRDLWTSAFPG